ncbi:hypothetical protein MRX96_013410 [Rhipicephalus microplus]
MTMTDVGKGLEVPKDHFYQGGTPHPALTKRPQQTQEGTTLSQTGLQGAQGEEVSKDSEDVPIEATDVPPDMESSDGSSGLQKCGQCGQYFSSAEVLLQHSVTHSWELAVLVS